VVLIYQITWGDSTMPRRKSDSFPAPDLSTPAGRITWLLVHLFDGNMRRMAEAVGVTHSIVSKIVGGQQVPGRRLMESIASHPKVNPGWLASGEGEPLLAARHPGPAECWEAPISQYLLPGPPAEHDRLFAGTSFPLAGGFYRPTRYLYRVGGGDPIARADAEKVAPGDLLLLDAGAEIWRANRQVLANALVVLHVRGRGGLDYALARIRSDTASGRLTFDAYGLDALATPVVGGNPGFKMRDGDVRRGRAIELDDTPAGSPATSIGEGYSRDRPEPKPKAPRPEARRVADRSDMPGALDIKDVVAISVMLIRS